VATEAAWLHGNNLEKEEIKKKKEKKRQKMKVTLAGLLMEGTSAQIVLIRPEAKSKTELAVNMTSDGVCSNISLVNPKRFK
jgi:hypothetical protein